MNAMADLQRTQNLQGAPKGMSLRYRIVRKVGYLLRLRLQDEPGLAWRLAMATLAWIVRFYSLTFRYSVDDKVGYFSGELQRGVIFLLWHNRIAAAPALYERRCRQRPAFVLSSTTPEGALLALFVRHFGLGAVRIATFPRATNALREMIRRMEGQQDLIVTPDGPLGPRYHLKSGALYLAQNTGRPIVPLHVEYSRYVRFKSWDRFAVPFPFARVRLVFDKPFWISASFRNDQFEAERARIEKVMTDGLVMDRAEATR
jgi:lysophospholipid acyltransferase (LPLAT)-like uncharacterized protein